MVKNECDKETDNKSEDITNRILFSNKIGLQMLGLGFIDQSASIEDKIQTSTNLLIKRFFLLKRTHANLYETSNNEE